MAEVRILRELNRLDLAIYTAIAASPTPSLDSGLRRLSNAANYSRVSMAAAAGMAVFAGPEGRRAAVRGLASIAVTSAVMNIAIKPVARRRRPDRLKAEVPESRHVKMPTSHSFPSGHSAAAFAFAAGAGRTIPWSAPPLTILASAVAYSRIHTGVHYPGDVIIGALCGVTIAELTNIAIDGLLAG
ncbi:MAG: phosphatase PAP2 family protein [Cryobacterium sp.]|nr:phosphatase PAP2 family protein [Cryobacterium sp.]